MAVHLEVFFAASYAVFLLAVALGLDLIARHSHKRSEQYRTAGFTYHHTHDAWICPENQILTRSETDHERRLVRYRGRPQICNHCPSKADCTDSDGGREILRTMDTWPHSEAGRFHRGISLTLALLAGTVLVVEALRNHAPLELTFLCAAFLTVSFIGWHLHAAFRTTPANFPLPASRTPHQLPTEPLRKGYKKGEEEQRWTPPSTRSR